MAERVTAADRRLVRDFLHQYVSSGQDIQDGMPFTAFERANKWAQGYTFTEIAEEEGVSPQSIGKQVRRIVYQLRAYLKEDQ